MRITTSGTWQRGHSHGWIRVQPDPDWLGAGYGDVVSSVLALTAELTDAERAAIVGGTARAVYQLGSR